MTVQKTVYALNTAGAAGFDIMDKVVANAVAEQETAQQVETEPQTETSREQSAPGSLRLYIL